MLAGNGSLVGLQVHLTDDVPGCASGVPDRLRLKVLAAAGVREDPGDRRNKRFSVSRHDACACAGDDSFEGWQV